MPPVYPPELYVRPINWRVRDMDTVGDGTGTKNANGDYSTTPQYFRIDAGDAPLVITALHIVAGGTGSIAADNYSVLNGALTNGVTFGVLNPDGTPVTQPEDSTAIKRNADWSKYTINYRKEDYGGGVNFMVVEWETNSIGGAYLVPGQSFYARLNDDFTGLTDHFFSIEGFRAG